LPSKMGGIAGGEVCSCSFSRSYSLLSLLSLFLFLFLSFFLSLPLFLSLTSSLSLLSLSHSSISCTEIRPQRHHLQVCAGPAHVGVRQVDVRRGREARRSRNQGRQERAARSQHVL